MFQFWWFSPHFPVSYHAQFCRRAARKDRQQGSLAVQWLELCASTARGMGSIPDWATKIPHASQHSQKKKKKKKKRQQVCLHIWKEHICPEPGAWWAGDTPFWAGDKTASQQSCFLKLHTTLSRANKTYHKQVDQWEGESRELTCGQNSSVLFCFLHSTAVLARPFQSVCQDGLCQRTQKASQSPTPSLQPPPATEWSCLLHYKFTSCLISIPFTMSWFKFDFILPNFPHFWLPAWPQQGAEGNKGKFW